MRSNGLGNPRDELDKSIPKTGQDGLRTRPINPVFVLDNGLRIPFSIRYSHWSNQIGDVWIPIIEGDVAKIMHRIVAVDADEWSDACGFVFPSFEGCSDEWAQRLMENSPKVGRTKTNSGLRIKPGAQR